ncbi:hypothetical protein AMECASPLE_005874 [Ameca splendens]|uniref:Uncharacterized protein n=1 Tax=Ameca splendens TaxID=208324 RepID=A0ABV0Z9R0_9TELE
MVGLVQAWGQITISLTTLISFHTLAPPLTPEPPLHLDSHRAKLFCSDFHLPPPLSPLTVLSPPPPPHSPPTASPAGPTDRHQRQADKPRTTPTHLHVVFCVQLSYVTKDESEMHLIG